ncbi:MAG TPA: four helix bundle protein [Cyclobacteriaceae bacterium]|nr:four helix bundle protein [Cyclobacteriaceae bacterium]
MKYDLEQRLIRFSVSIVRMTQSLPNDRACNHLAGQLIRSGTAPALLYGEAAGAESRKDFIHKMKIGLKELRETSICLKIISETGYISSADQQEMLFNENKELIAIFQKSVSTATKNLQNNGG